MKDFWASEATLNTVMLAYHLMSLLRQVLLKTSTVKHSSSTIQHTLHHWFMELQKIVSKGAPLWGGIKQDHVLRTWFVYSQRLAYLHHRGKAGITCPVTAPCKVLHA